MSSPSGGTNDDPSGTTQQRCFYESNPYKFVLGLVGRFCRARDDDELPDADTGRVLGTNGPMGQTLFGAMITLRNHGRISRTMLEQALICGPASYPECISLWIASLAPKERSQYAADLYNSNFKGLVWDTKMYASLRDMHVKDGFLLAEPPQPIGDDRHEPRKACAARFVSDFFNLFRYEFYWIAGFGTGTGS